MNNNAVPNKELEEPTWPNHVNLYMICPRCGGNGVVERSKAEVTCPSCQGEGVLTKER